MNSLVLAIKELVENESLRKKMSQNSYRLGMTFDIDIQYQKFLLLVEKIIKKNHNSQVSNQTL
jgi:hypothetical protein